MSFSACSQTLSASVNLYLILYVRRYSVFRRVVEYYSDDPMGGKAGEDAYDMRKPLSRDKKLLHVREHGETHRIHPEDLYHG